jgi:hypothetical protein
MQKSPAHQDLIPAIRTTVEGILMESLFERVFEVRRRMKRKFDTDDRV